MISIRSLVFVPVLCCVLAVVARAQPPDDADIIEQDYKVRTVEDRQRTITELKNKAEELRKSGNNVEAARTLNRVGRFQLRMFTTDASIETFNGALRLVDTSPDIYTRIDSLNGLALSYDYQSNCASATKFAQQAIKLSQSVYPAGEAEGLLTLSDCQNYSNHSEALKTASRSLELWRSIGSKRGMADAYQVIAHYQLSLNDLLEASANAQASRALYRELNDADREATVVIYLAIVESDKGSWQSAMSLYTEAQGMIDEKAEPYKMGQIAIGLGNAFLETGLPDYALSKYADAQKLFEQTQNQRAITAVQWSIGKAQYFAGTYEDALHNLNAARVSADADPTLAASCDDFLGRTYAALADHDSALRHFNAALDGFTRTGDKLEAARVQALMGQVYQQQGKQQKARDTYQLALRTFRALSDHVNESATLFVLGNLELEQGNLRLAENFLRQSIDVTENIRRQSSSSDLTLAFSAAVYDRYQSYIDCLMQEERDFPNQGFAVRALEASELARARSLIEWLRAADANLAPGADPKLIEQEKTIRHMLRIKEDARVRMLAGTYERTQLRSLESELLDLDKKHKEVVSAIQTQYPAYQQISNPPSWGLNEIQQKVVVDNNTVLLEYSLGKRRSYVWAITRDRLTSYEIAGEPEVVQKAQQLYSLLSADPKTVGGDQLAKAAQDLSLLILAPVRAELNKPRIVLVADGVLNYIPFQLLPSPLNTSSLLVANHEIVNAPSASILGGLGRAMLTRQPEKLLAVFGDPLLPVNHDSTTAAEDYVAGLSTPGNERWHQGLRDIQLNPESGQRTVMQPLFHVKRELANLRELTDARDILVATGDQATRERLLDTDLSNFAILHFATHGLLDAKRPENSGLLLSTISPDGKALNGFVSLQDIYQLQAPVDLVVLSACQTGLGKDVRGEGLVGLTRGFIYAGASSVVASLWKVDDEATAELMKRFYTNILREGMPPAAALKAAQNSIRQEPQWSSPYYWAAFTLQGDFRQTIKPVARRSSNSTVLLGVLAALLASGGLFYFIRRKRTPAN